MNKAFALAKQDVRQPYRVGKLAVSGAVVVLLTVVSSRLLEHKGAPNPLVTERPASTQPGVVVAHNVASEPPKQEMLRGPEIVESPFIFPSSKQGVDSTKLVFRWKPVLQARLYEVEVVTDEGSVVWTGKVRGTSAALPSNIHLVNGGSYFVRLRIHTVHGSVEVTKAIEFIAESGLR